MAPSRVSIVGEVKIQAIVYASTFFVGDNRRILPRTQALAVRRDIPLFLDSEGNFAAYDIFRRSLPPWPAAGGPVRMRTVHADPRIRVRTVDIISVSTASVFQIGSSGLIESRNRVKHFRQLLALTPPGSFPTGPVLPSPD